MAVQQLRPAQIGGGSALGLLAATALREFSSSSPTAAALAGICESVEDATFWRLAEEAAERVPGPFWAALAGFAGAYLGCVLALRYSPFAARRFGAPPRPPLLALRA